MKLRKFCLHNQLLESIFDLLVPQTIDQGVEHGDDHGIEHRQNFVCVHGMTGAGLGVHKDGGPIEDGDCGEVRSAGGQSLLISLSRVHPQNGDQYEQVGNQDNQEGKKDIEACHKGKN